MPPRNAPLRLGFSDVESGSSVIVSDHCVFCRIVPSDNGSDQWLAPTRLSIPLGLIASPLHRMVRGSGPPLQTAARTTAKRSLTPSGPARPESRARHRERRGIRMGRHSRRCWALLHLPIRPPERPDREQPPIAPGHQDRAAGRPDRQANEETRRTSKGNDQTWRKPRGRSERVP